jgi:hypothetical protein
MCSASAKSTLKINLCKNYYVVQLNGTNIARAAQLYPELRPALKELIQKHCISPRGPVTRRLLELADNPPLHTKKFNILTGFILFGAVAQSRGAKAFGAGVPKTLQRRP